MCNDKEFYLSNFMIASEVPESRFVTKTNCFALARYVLSDNFAVAKLGRKTKGKVCKLGLIKSFKCRNANRRLYSLN